MSLQLRVAHVGEAAVRGVLHGRGVRHGVHGEHLEAAVVAADDEVELPVPRQIVAVQRADGGAGPLRAHHPPPHGRGVPGARGARGSGEGGGWDNGGHEDSPGDGHDADAAVVRSEQNALAGLAAVVVGQRQGCGRARNAHLVAQRAGR